VQSSAVTWNMKSSMPGRFRERIKWNRERLEGNWLHYKRVDPMIISPAFTCGKMVI
jgi:hypothetical protein